MSQAKVDKYKADKKNRKQIMAKDKRKKLITTVIVLVVVVAMVVGLLFSILGQWL